MTVPGYLVWLALFYAIINGIAAFALGRPLVPAKERRQAAEAEFRVALVRLRDAGPPARGGGMAVLRPLFAAVGRSWDGQTRSMARLSGCNAGPLRVPTTFPIPAGLPGCFQGVVTLGDAGGAGLPASGGGADLPVTSMERVATWGASVERVLALAAVLEARAVPLPEGVPVAPE